ncbi:MAG: hypothetical protein QXS76_04320 [Candidatus Bathyarchaeia archaeon]
MKAELAAKALLRVRGRSGLAIRSFTSSGNGRGFPPRADRSGNKKAAEEAVRLAESIIGFVERELEGL